MYDIAIAIDHAPFAIDEPRLRQALDKIFADAGLREAQVSVAILDDPTVHELNVRYLQHDYPTDVLSFVLEADDERLEGEIIASADTAARTAQSLGWSADDELLLYIVHGALHLVGHDDHEPADKARMRAAEAAVFQHLGLTPRYDEE